MGALARNVTPSPAAAADAITPSPARASATQAPGADPASLGHDGHRRRGQHLDLAHHAVAAAMGSGASFPDSSGSPWVWACAYAVKSSRNNGNTSSWRTAADLMQAMGTSRSICCPRQERVSGRRDFPYAARARRAANVVRSGRSPGFRADCRRTCNPRRSPSCPEAVAAFTRMTLA